MTIFLNNFFLLLWLSFPMVIFHSDNEMIDNRLQKLMVIKKKLLSNWQKKKCKIVK